MKIIHNKMEIEKYRREHHLERIFSDETLPFLLYEYEAGEFLSSPLHQGEMKLQYLLSGKVHVYGLHDSARLVPINLMQKGTLMGDMEYVKGRNYFYCQAITPVKCLVLPIEENREKLDHDICFLRYLTHALADKVYLGQEGPSLNLSVEERLLNYIQNNCPGQTLDGVENATLTLRCSRRQLQRTLKKLCEEGRLMKVGRGKYVIRY